MALSKDTTFFKIFDFIFNILTTWYIAEIIMFISFSVSVIVFFSIFKNYNLYNFLLLDRILFAKQYLYRVFREKLYFIKSFVYVSKKELKKYGIYFLLFIVLGAIFIFFLVYVVPSYR